MAELLYLEDSYLKNFDAEVVELNGNEVILDKTAFYPTSGGVMHDTGKIFRNNEAFNVVDVIKKNNEVIHIVDKSGLKVGDKVSCEINWERRYKLMRMHTACHLISGIFYKVFNVLITGNKIDINESRIDFNLEKFDREIIKELIERANLAIKNDYKVKVYFMNREEAMKIEGIVKLAKALPPNIETLRIVEIENIDIQADGGPHVKSLKEIGEIEILKLENKGKSNRRIYFTVKP